jgi:hypothetical protein
MLLIELRGRDFQVYGDLQIYLLTVASVKAVPCRAVEGFSLSLVSFAQLPLIDKSESGDIADLAITNHENLTDYIHCTSHFRIFTRGSSERKTPSGPHGQMSHSRILEG